MLADLLITVSFLGNIFIRFCDSLQSPDESGSLKKYATFLREERYEKVTLSKAIQINLACISPCRIF